MKKNVLQLFFVVGGLLVACSPKTTQVSEGKTEQESTTKTLSADAQKGKELYAMYCGKCHRLEPIHEYSEARWRKIVPDMSAKAKLNAEQENFILTYVLEELK